MGDEGEASAQLQEDTLDLAQDGALEVALAVGSRESQQIEKVRIAKDDVGGHVSVAQLRELRRDDGFRFSRQRGALEQHAADLLPKRAHIPTLDSAHFGVEIASQLILDRQQRMNM